VTNQRQTETEEQGAKRKKTMQECVTKQRNTETEEQSAKRKKTMQECVTKQRQTETEEQGAKHKKTDPDFKRRKREEMRHQLQSNREYMTNVIDRAAKEAKQSLHRTRDPGNPHRHRATVLDCLTAACKALSLANAKGKGTNGSVIRSLDD